MHVTAHQPRPTRENPRTARVREIILDAAAELLVREGASAATPVRVAEETGVARTTIYRHWSNPTALLLDAIDRVVAPHVPTSITDNLEEDLITALSNLRGRMTKKPFRLIFTALLDHANGDRDLVAAQRRFVSGVVQPIHDILTAAIKRGDLPSTVDVEAASAQLAGPLFLQHVMLRTTISERLIKETISQFLCGRPGNPPHVATGLSAAGSLGQQPG